jgi:hypothetical protein
MSQQANCPSCGGPCEFKVGTSLVTICPYCQSVVGRGDKGLEDLGKVADLVESGSPLDVWLQGRYGGVPFTLTGRVQFAHPAGGVWDEWYASFADGRIGWLAEAMGRFFLTFQVQHPPHFPAYEALHLGHEVNLGPGTPQLHVSEKNRGKTAGARGEIPYRLIPGREHPFADLSGPGGAFGTLDFSESPPLAFAGREVTLDELGIPPANRRRVPGEGPRVAALALNCPQCGAALALRAPDRSERVGCPSCGALLDVHQGSLRLLESLKPPKVKPAIPLGAVGKRDGAEWTTLGFMRRAVTIDGEDCFWEEYLLYQPRYGFRWLVRSDNHWNWVEPLPPGTVRVAGREARYADKVYYLYQKAKYRVVFVVGEFYWKVHAGEKVFGRDFIRPPEILSEEVTREGSEGEINWSKGTYLTRAEVEKMFGLQQRLPAPIDVGPNQPFPHTGVYRYALWLLAAALVAACVLWGVIPHRQVLRHTYELQPLPAGTQSRRIAVPQALELRGRRNIRVTLVAKSDLGASIEGEFNRERPAPKPRREPFAVTARPHQASSVYLTAVPEGRYSLWFDVTWQDTRQPSAIEVRVEQGSTHLFPFVLTVLLLASVPFVVGLYHIYFEASRWQGSNALGQRTS